MEAAGWGPEVCRERVVDGRARGSGGNWCVSRGDSGENEGNDVRDLSEAAMDEAELDGCDVSFRALLPRTVCVWDL